ncbi:MAG: transposase [Rhodospirillaceae bacterium]|nr:transposase [Rhodospirillaceae bacterium]
MGVSARFRRTGTQRNHVNSVGTGKRNIVERCINKLKHFRHIVTHYNRLASAYLTFATIAAVRLWLRFHELTA